MNKINKNETFEEYKENCEYLKPNYVQSKELNGTYFDNPLQRILNCGHPSNTRAINSKLCDINNDFCPFNNEIAIN